MGVNTKRYSILSIQYFHKNKKWNVPQKHIPFFCTPDENRTHIVGTGIRYSIH